MTEREQAIRAIFAERQRQIDREGYDALHDSRHDPAMLAAAGECYWFWRGRGESEYGGAPGGWPWNREYWKPKTLERDLERSGALFLAAEAAELARIERGGDNQYGWGAARARNYHDNYTRAAKELAWVLADPEVERPRFEDELIVEALDRLRASSIPLGMTEQQFNAQTILDARAILTRNVSGSSAPESTSTHEGDPES